MKGGLGLRRKISAFDRNLTYFCYVNKEKINLKKTTYTEQRSVHTNSESCNMQLGS